MTLPSTCFRSALALAVGLGTLSLTAPVAQASELLQAAGAAQPSFPTALALPLPPPPVRIFAITAERRALLNTIRFGEGTWADGDDYEFTTPVTIPRTSNSFIWVMSQHSRLTISPIYSPTLSFSNIVDKTFHSITID